jgi:light-harvesting complex I chlorophyll a/b binding protein 1
MAFASIQTRVGVNTARPFQQRRAVTMRAAVSDQRPFWDRGQVYDNPIEYAKSLPGICDPFPNMFDPFGLVKNATNVNEVKRWRESELTHGRVAMLAAVGFLINENVENWPAFARFSGGITGPAIYQFQQVKSGFWEPLLLVIAIAECYRVSIGWQNPTNGGFWKLNEDYEPGHLGFDPLNLAPKDPDAWYDMQTRELNNGRLAMIAVAGFVAQELVDQRKIFDGLYPRFNW